MHGPGDFKCSPLARACAPERAYSIASWRPRSAPGPQWCGCRALPGPTAGPDPVRPPGNSRQGAVGGQGPFGNRKPQHRVTGRTHALAGHCRQRRCSAGRPAAATAQSRPQGPSSGSADLRGAAKIRDPNQAGRAVQRIDPGEVTFPGQGLISEGRAGLTGQLRFSVIFCAFPELTGGDGK